LAIFLLRLIKLRYKKTGHSRYGHSVRQVQASRSKRAKAIDAGLKAPIAKTPEQWMKQPNRFDLPNIDTPKRKR
jgi:hypothetical protein